MREEMPEVKEFISTIPVIDSFAFNNGSILEFKVYDNEFTARGQKRIPVIDWEREEKRFDEYRQQKVISIDIGYRADISCEVKYEGKNE